MPGVPTSRMVALDGLRGVAIFMVLSHHVRAVYAPQFDQNVIPGGFLGVDVFFVLSGFLITSLLLAERERRNRIGLGAFYRRRAMRLLPALVVLLVAHMVYAAQAGIPYEVERRSILSIFFYYSNWRQTLVLPEGVGHLWSLAVEEQFYLIWPIALVALVAFTRGRVRQTAAVIAVAVVGLAVYRAWRFEQGMFFLWIYVRTDTRADSLLVGALIAFIVTWLTERKRPIGSRRWIGAAAWASVLFVTWCVLFLPYQRPFYYLGGFTAVAVAVAIVIVASLPGSTWSGRKVLQWKPLCLLGLVSYGVYLWHFPVFVATQRYAPDVPALPRAMLGLALTAVVVTLSWVLVEKPFLRWKARLDQHESDAPSPERPVAQPAAEPAS